MKHFLITTIAAGVDVNAKDNYGDYGKTPPSYAKDEIADLLRKLGGKTGEALKAEWKYTAQKAKLLNAGN